MLVFVVAFIFGLVMGAMVMGLVASKSNYELENRIYTLWSIIDSKDVIIMNMNSELAFMRFLKRAMSPEEMDSWMRWYRDQKERMQDG